MNTELLDDNQRDALAASLPAIDPEGEETSAEPRKTTKYEPHWNDAGTHVIWEAVEVEEAPIPIEKPEPPKFNRAERRRLQRYILRKARRQVRQVERRQTRKIRELRGKRCGRCNLLFIGRAKWRCQCKAISARHEDLARQLQAMKEAEQASAAEAQRRLYDQRDWDDEQHRLAQENGANALT